MAYFPMFVEMKDRSVLIVGGGQVALRKVKTLLPYGADITTVAPEYCEELLAAAGIRRLTGCFSRELLQNAEIVVAATDDPALNHSIAESCRALRIPCNVVDNAPECSFFFPSTVLEGDLSIGVSTGGASPSAAIWMKNRIRTLIPANMSDILLFLRDSREETKKRITDEKTRARFFAWLLEECLQERIAPENGRLPEALERFAREERE